jgi:hypothetical protein
MLGYIISDKHEINVENYEIKSFDILHKTDLNIFVIKNNKVLYINNIINNACKHGNIQVLEWFKNSGYEFKYDENAIDCASQNGNVEVLEWFKNSGYEFKYDKNATNFASYNGRVEVLEWFKNSGYELKYDEHAIGCACFNGQIKILEWFKNSGYVLKYNKCAWFSLYSFVNNQILKFYSYRVNIKKLIKWAKKIIFIKTIKFKTNNKYLKGYQKN